MVDFNKHLRGRPPLPGQEAAEDRADVAAAAVDTSVEDRLRARLNLPDTEVEFLRGGPGDGWYDAAAEHPTFGWGGQIVEVGRDNGQLYADVDYGYRFYVPEDREIYIGPRRDPAPAQSVADDDVTAMFNGLAEHVRETEPDVPAAEQRQILLGDGDEPEAADIPQSDTPPDEPQFFYIAGTAGTGKTYLARQRAENYPDALLCATTGIAAINLGGTTINSVLRYKDTDDLRTNYELGILGATLKQLARSDYNRIIIDEVSMMDGNQLDVLTLAIDEHNEWRQEQSIEHPLGLTLVGDFAQLPPVKAPFVFQGKVPGTIRESWKRFEANTLMLTEPRRQADPEFVRALQCVRRGDKTAAGNYFNRFITQTEERNFDGTTILAKNDEVDRYNKIRMLELPDPPFWYEPVRVGEQASEWKNIPDRLEMKKGALVMILANRRERVPDEPPETWPMIYANGDLAHFEEWIDPPGGIVMDAEGRPASVQPTKEQRAMARVTLLRNGRSVIVARVIREKKRPTGAKGAKAPRDAKEGSIDYMPLRVAYATTVHKSQGLSLDRVQIMMHSMFWAQPGMAYVALSRARTPEGLRIVCTPAQFQSRVTKNPMIARWL